MKTTALPRLETKTQNNAIGFFKILSAKKSIFLACCAVLAAIALLMARGTVLTYCSPFALALCCAVPCELIPAAVIGAAAGYLSAGYEIVPARYLAALILAVILKRVFSPKIAAHPLFCGTVALLCCALTGFGTTLLLDEVEVTLLPYAAESFIAAAAAVFWSGSSRLLKRLKSAQQLPENELACLLISIFLIILSFTYITVWDLSIAKMLACFTVLLSAYYGKCAGASLAGIGAGLALGLGNEDVLAFAGFSIAGMLAGLAASHSKVLSAIALEAGLAAPVLFGMGAQMHYTPFIEAGIAALLFLLLPKKLLGRFRFFATAAHSVTPSSVQSYAVSRLRFAGEALGDVSTCVHTVSGKIKSISPNKKATVFLNTMHQTCDKCGLKYYCWEREKEYSISIFKKMEKMLENGEELTVDNLPGDFGAVCIRNKALIKNLTLEHAAYKANKLAGEKTAAMREVLSVQFDALSQLLFDLSQEVESKQFPEEALTDALKNLLEESETDYLSADVSTNAAFRVSVTLRVPYRQKYLESEDFRKGLETLCSARFSPAQITEYEDAVKLGFYEKAAYRCDIAYSQLSADNNRYCGDALEFVKDFSGNEGVVLADGMGQGLRANINATLSAGILSKLLASGFSPAAAIKIVNASLIVKDTDESFSSLDLMMLDPFEGRVDFYKAGATSSFVKRNNKVTRIELAGMPVGILENADFAQNHITVAEGDIVLLVSDGATQGDSDWIQEVLISPDYNTPEELANLICQTALKKQYGVHEDDITAIAVFISAQNAPLLSAQP